MELEGLRLQLKDNAIAVTDEMHEDLVHIFERSGMETSPFMQLFWAEQAKYIQQSRNGVRYHPQIIQYCLRLWAKSAAAYDCLRYDPNTGEGVLILPSRRRLSDYRNYIR